MERKIAIITGANSGIGKETARGLAEMGASLVIVCRDKGKATETKREIALRTGNENLEAMAGDLLLQRDVRRLAAEFSQTHDRLDVLVNNAGTVFTRFAETDEGVERTMAVNYFAPFLLTNLLLDLLKKSAPSRVVNVSSTAHYSGRIGIGNLGKERSMGIGGLKAYSRSKLALVLFTNELARRLGGTGVTANCLHPGAVRTKIWARGAPLPFVPFVEFATLFMSSPRRGAETPIFLASSPEVEGVSGKYFEHKREKRSSTDSYDPDLARKLWEVSAELVGLG